MHQLRYEDITEPVPSQSPVLVTPGHGIIYFTNAVFPLGFVKDFTMSRRYQYAVPAGEVDGET